MDYNSVRKCIHIKIERRYSLLHEKAWTGETVYLLFVKDMAYPEKVTISGRIGINRKEQMDYQISDLSKRPYNIKYKKVIVRKY